MKALRQVHLKSFCLRTKDSWVQSFKGTRVCYPSWNLLFIFNTNVFPISEANLHSAASPGSFCRSSLSWPISFGLKILVSLLSRIPNWPVSLYPWGYLFKHTYFRECRTEDTENRSEHYQSRAYHPETISLVISVCGHQIGRLTMSLMQARFSPCK